MFFSGVYVRVNFRLICPPRRKSGNFRIGKVNDVFLSRFWVPLTSTSNKIQQNRASNTIREYGQTNPFSAVWKKSLSVVSTFPPIRPRSPPRSSNWSSISTRASPTDDEAENRAKD